MTDQTNQPIDKVILGTVQVAIWKNTNANGYTYYSVSHENRYRDGNADWKPTQSYTRDESLVLSGGRSPMWQTVSRAPPASSGVSPVKRQSE